MGTKVNKIDVFHFCLHEEQEEQKHQQEEQREMEGQQEP